MTVTALMKLEEISNIQTDLEWRSKSYDAGHPLCVCSGCGERILSSDDFEDPDCQEARDHFPIRLWRGENKAMEEATLHFTCFELLNAKGVMDLNEDPDLDEQL